MITSEPDISVTVRITTIRDGTHGISISLPGQLIGEWTDSTAISLTITDGHYIGICSGDGSQRYLVTIPGTPFNSQQISDTEAIIATRM